MSGVAFKKIMERYEEDDLLYAARFIFVGDNPRKDFLVGNTFDYPTVMLVDDGDNIHRQNVRVPSGYRPRFKVKTLSSIITKMDKGAFA